VSLTRVGGPGVIVDTPLEGSGPGIPEVEGGKKVHLISSSGAQL
jgi:hypothetical protein